MLYIIYNAKYDNENKLLSCKCIVILSMTAQVLMIITYQRFIKNIIYAVFYFCE